MTPTAAEAAIQTWVEGASGATAIFSGQGGPRPARPFVTITIEETPVGQDWHDHTHDPGGDPGEEITHYVRGMRHLTIRLQAFADDPAGAAGAKALLDAVIAKARLPSFRDALAAAEVGILSFGTIKRIDGVINSADFEPRAVVEVRACTTSEVSEKNTFIETVEVTNEIPDPDEVFTVQ